MTETPVSSNQPSSWMSQLPWPDYETHKHSRGRLHVIAGSPLRTGAARLAARAGQRVGAGWVQLHGEQKAASVMAGLETSIMVRLNRCADIEGLGDRPDAIVFGPAAGLDGQALAWLWALLEHPSLRSPKQVSLVLDADALTLASYDFDRFAKAAKTTVPILTPHTGEFERLFGLPLGPGSALIPAARDAVHRSGALMVLKGPETVIAHPDGRTCLSSHATPFLATAGTGDVLAGLIGGLCAQGMEPFLACCAAVWIHGEAGRRIGPGLIAEDLITMIPQVLADLAPEGLKPERWSG
jgi:ADP-dependent NAD(P)H-hydrate dehydratase / NAD(P)H-hydrate epimerase